MNKSIDDIDFEKSGGLVPVIVQDANTKDVLTLAYAINKVVNLRYFTLSATVYGKYNDGYEEDFDYD